MKFIGFKEPAAIIKSGIVGALALPGICIILIIVANLMSAALPFIAYPIAKLQTKYTLEELLITSGSIGFVLGMTVRRRLPVIHKGIVPLVIAAVPLIIGAWLLNAYAIRVSIPRHMKLADCTNSVVKFHLNVPKGYDYTLGLNTSGVQQMPNGTLTSSYKFSGHIRIASGAVFITDFPFDSDRTLLIASGFILTGIKGQSTNLPTLSGFIQAQRAYDIEITFDPPPPRSSSIWLHWLQTIKDGDRR